MSLANNVKKLRLSTGKSLRVFAKEIGVSYQAVWHWEKGHKDMRAAHRQAYMKKFKVSESDLYK